MSPLELKSLNKSSNTYVAARYYRSPEIVLEYPRKGFAIDIWSMGCTLAEMYKGNILFKGFCNRDLLWNQMLILGPVPRQLIRASRRGISLFHLSSQLTTVSESACHL